MKFNLSDSLILLGNTPEVLKKQLAGVPSAWLNVNEGGDSWTVTEVMAHLIHTENDNWVQRVKVILSNDEDKRFKPLNRTEGFETNSRRPVDELLKEFEALRQKNLIYLREENITQDILGRTGIHPEFGEVTLRQLLSTWVVHDQSHISQISRLLAKQYKDETGPWINYLSILTG